MAKRSFDLCAACLVLLLLMPLFAVVAVAIRVLHGGPVFYRQVRVGRSGRTFRIFKFRTMVTNADRIGGYATADNDARITPVGRFLRRTSIDELPQLFNVVTGDMSIVGPRPDVPAQKELYSEEEFAKRHAVRPGITGLAQATLRSDVTAEQRKALDLEYVDKAGIMFDLRIIVMTIKQMLKKGGN